MMSKSDSITLEIGDHSVIFSNGIIEIQFYFNPIHYSFKNLKNDENILENCFFGFNLEKESANKIVAKMKVKKKTRI